jgi:hypothetical protein
VEPLPQEYSPARDPSKGTAPASGTTFFVALAGSGEAPITPLLGTLQEALDTHPQQCQGGLYAAQTSFVIIRREGGNGRVLYTWSAGAQKWKLITGE